MRSRARNYGINLRQKHPLYVENDFIQVSFGILPTCPFQTETARKTVFDYIIATKSHKIPIAYEGDSDLKYFMGTALGPLSSWHSCAVLLVRL